MTELRTLYQEMILDHGRHPRNCGSFREATHHKEGFNPLCGDKIMLHLLVKDGSIEKMMFEGTGCAISIASASLMTECLQNKSKKEAEDLFVLFHQLVTGHPIQNEKLGKLAILSGVAEFPIRVKCATLAWHTLKAVLANDTGIVSTEIN